MKKIALLSLGMFTLIACNNPKNTSVENTEEQPKTEEQKSIGGEKDEHGCIGAAGYTWSESKQDCVRLFEVGLRLNPTETQKDVAVVSAFVLFNDDKSKAEVFLPEKTLILDKNEKGLYQNDIYKFDENENALYINGEKKYEAEK